MDRASLYEAWRGFYSGKSRQDAITAITERASFLEERMWRLARYPHQQQWHGIGSRSLQVALGMSLGVHKQLLWGLTSASSGVVNLRVAGGNRSRTATLSPSNRTERG